MSLSISDMKTRIAMLEAALDFQSSMYIKGYHRALVDQGIHLSDIEFEELDLYYRRELEENLRNNLT